MVLKGWYSILFILLSIIYTSDAQTSVVQCINPEFEQLVDGYLDYDIPTISVADAYDAKEKFTFLDARELEEYNVSHIKGAIHIGYDHFDSDQFEAKFQKDKPYIVYCSIGYRSEKIGEKLKKKGYTQIFNLYGSIFEWVNQHRPVVDQNGNPTVRLHTYSKKWGKWVEAEEIEKTW